MSLGVPRELTEPTKKKNKKLNMHNRMNNTFIKGKTTSKGLKTKKMEHNNNKSDNIELNKNKI